MNFWLKLRVWTKITVFAILTIYIGLFLLFNTGKPATLWLFPSWLIKDHTGSIESSVLFLALGSFVFGIIATLLTRTIWRTIAQIRVMKRKKMEKEAAAIIARAAKLQTRPVGVAPTSSVQGFPVQPATDAAASKH